MKIKKGNEYNSLITYKTRKIISLIIAGTSIFSLAACKNKEAEKDYTTELETSGISYTDGNYEKYETEFYTENAKEEITSLAYEEETSYEYDETDYQSIIDSLMEKQYQSNYDVFNDYDIIKRPSMEKSQIMAQNLDGVMEEKNYDNKSYDWYENGVVNQDKIYNKILKNTSTFYNDDNTKLIAKTISEVAQTNIDFMKKTYPNYDLDIALYALDNLKVGVVTEANYVCSTSAKKLKITVNFDNLSSIDELKYSMSHELFHLFVIKSYGRDDVLIDGAGIDAMNTAESPLEVSFLSETFAESSSHLAFNRQDPNDYWDIYKLTDLLCYSTGKNRQYFMNNFVNNNRTGLINGFEKGLNNFDFAYSVFDAIDIALGFNDVTKELQNRGNFDIARVQGEALNYARFNLYKNFVIRKVNELQKGSITKEEALTEIYNFEDTLASIGDDFYWVVSDKDNFDNQIDELTGIFKTQLKSNVIM